ncbi:MAG: DUF4097 family beta strand repeat-containing protein [Lachnospiraceae bacterium]
MKKWIKITALTGAALFGVGSITALAAIGFGARPGMVNFSEDGVRYIDIDKMEESWDDWCDWDDRQERRRERHQEGQNQPVVTEQSQSGQPEENQPVFAGQSSKFAPEEIWKIEADLLGGQVEILPVSDSQIEIILDEEAQERGVCVRQEEGELKVSQRKRGGIRDTKEEFGAVQIRIPQQMSLRELECDIDIGACTINGIQAESMDLATEAGSIEVLGARTGELDASAGIGSILYEGIAERSVEGECGVGDLEFRLEGKPEEFNYNLEIGVGSVEIDGSEYSGLGMEKRIDNRAQGAGKTMDLEVGTGSVVVSFYQ